MCAVFLYFIEGMFNFTVTCGDKLWEIVSETMYLESLGFVAPATTRNVTIRVN